MPASSTGAVSTFRQRSRAPRSSGPALTALSVGGFGIGAVLAGSLVPEHRRASAVSVLFAGLTIANVLGVPAGTFVGQRVG